VGEVTCKDRYLPQNYRGTSRWNRVVRHKVWEVFIYEMRISKQSKIENIYEAVSEIGDAGSLTSLLMTDDYIGDKLADKMTRH
jgi:hypothetical protein